MILCRGNGQARHMHRSHLREVDIPLGADPQIGAEVYLAPYADLQFICGAKIRSVGVGALLTGPNVTC